jgi:hypothetical protein
MNEYAQEMKGFESNHFKITKYGPMLLRDFAYNCSSATSVSIYLTTRRSNPEDSHLHIRRRDNLESTSTAVYCNCTAVLLQYFTAVAFAHVMTITYVMSRLTSHC